MKEDDEYIDLCHPYEHSEEDQEGREHNNLKVWNMTWMTRS